MVQTNGAAVNVTQCKTDTNAALCETWGVVDQGNYGTCWLAAVMNALFLSENIRYLLLPTVAEMVKNYDKPPLLLKDSFRDMIRLRFRSNKETAQIEVAGGLNDLRYTPSQRNTIESMLKLYFHPYANEGAQSQECLLIAGLVNAFAGQVRITTPAKKEHYARIQEEHKTQKISKILTTKLQESLNKTRVYQNAFLNNTNSKNLTLGQKDSYEQIRKVIDNSITARIWSSKNFKKIKRKDVKYGNYTDVVMPPLLYHVMGFTRLLPIDLSGQMIDSRLSKKLKEIDNFPQDSEDEFQKCVKVISSFIENEYKQHTLEEPLLIALKVPKMYDTEIPHQLGKYTLQSCAYVEDDYSTKGNGDHAVCEVKCNGNVYYLNSQGKNKTEIRRNKSFEFRNDASRYVLLYAADWQPEVQNSIKLIKELDNSRFLDQFRINKELKNVSIAKKVVRSDEIKNVEITEKDEIKNIEITETDIKNFEITDDVVYDDDGNVVPEDVETLDPPVISGGRKVVRSTASKKPIKKSPSKTTKKQSKQPAKKQTKQQTKKQS